MSNISRRSFLTTLASTTAALSLGATTKQTFHDIRPDLFYALYDENGWQRTPAVIGDHLVDGIVYACKNETVTTADGNPWYLQGYEKEEDVSSGKDPSDIIEITSEWLINLYHHHA